jgi:hypothetical protein
MYSARPALAVVQVVHVVADGEGHPGVDVERS